MKRTLNENTGQKDEGQKDERDVVQSIISKYMKLSPSEVVCDQVICDEVVDQKVLENDKQKVCKVVFKAEKESMKALAQYFPNFLTEDEADLLFNVIIGESHKYTQDKVNTPGGIKNAPRITGTYGPEGVVYKYAGMTRHPIVSWPQELRSCMEKISTQLGCKLNYAFINVYRDGEYLKEDYIGWHKDSEKEIICNNNGETTIASISLGDERIFQMRVEYKKGESPTQITSVKLQHGSLCTMEKQMQRFCKHQVPKYKDAKGMRVNITFRNMSTRVK